METVVTARFEEARRSRLALFGGRVRTLEIAGASYTGVVHSVCEVESSDPPAWRVRLIPLKPAHKTNAAVPGPASHHTVAV
jgi:hypothetical protein